MRIFKQISKGQKKNNIKRQITKIVKLSNMYRFDRLSEMILSHFIFLILCKRHQIESFTNMGQHGKSSSYNISNTMEIGKKIDFSMSDFTQY